MQLLKIKPSNVMILLLTWLSAANLLEILVINTHFWLWQLLFFGSMVFLPGLALLRVLRPPIHNLVWTVLYSFGLSILIIMLAGLAINQMGGQSLNTMGAWAGWEAFTLALILIGARSADSMSLRIPKVSKTVLIVVLLSLVLPALVVMGTIRLNNGFDGIISLIALFYTAALVIMAVVLRNRLPDGALSWLIFVISLSVLLMTSLRGWDIVGHDIEREFRVYTLTHDNLHWNISYDRDPYNACLSITILPQMFNALLGISGVFVFKVILQVVFALCPVVIYQIMRRHLGKMSAIVGCMIFISYPTFINDSVMLTRQGIAYTFFALALLTMDWAKDWRGKALFVLCGLGAILSHYSTSYMFVGLFVLAVLSKYTLRWWFRRQHKTEPKHLERSTLSPVFATVLLLMTFMWYTQITATTKGLFDTLKTSFAQIPSIFSSDNKSTDTSAALLFAGKQTAVGLYNSYLTTTKQTRTDASQFNLTNDDLPLTWLGKKAVSIGANPSAIETIRQDFAKILQLLAIAGVAYVIYHLMRRKINTPSLDYICISAASLVLLAAMVVLPVLSVNYGILRAFQQALIFLVLPITFLLHRLGLWLPRGRVVAATSFIVLLFFLFTGVFANLLGGTSPTLSLNNSGIYFGLYYENAADAASFKWLGQNISKNSDVRSANPGRATMHWPDYPFTSINILPNQLYPNSVVYLDQSQVVNQKYYTYYQSSPLIINYPTNYYDAHKNLIFSTVQSRVYQ